MKNFFISYNKADKEWAQWLDWQLRSKGYGTFTQFGDIPWGSNFVARMDEGLREAERIILLLSPDFLSSGYTEAEWTTMFTRDPTGSKRLLLPIRVRECELKGLLAARVYLDLWDQDEPGATSMLAGGLSSLDVTPAPSNAENAGTAPPFPYLHYDYIVQFCEPDGLRVQGLASQLESQQKRIWRDVWNTSPGSPVRKNNPPASLRFGCWVVCAGDATPIDWTRIQIQDTLRRQRQEPELKVIPVLFGSGSDALRQKFSEEIFFWADSSNAVHLLLAAANGTNMSGQEWPPAVADPYEVFLQKLQKLAPLLNPAVVQQAQLDLIKDLQKATYGGR